MEKKITIELSKKSIAEAIQKLEKYLESLSVGTNNGVKEATETLYRKVIDNCNEGNLGRFIGEVHQEYDKSKNIGRVWTKDMVVIINEYGSGIRGSESPHPKANGWKYDVNNHGEKGWWYPTDSSDPNPHKWVDDDGQLRALTRGIKSKRMFYNAYKEVKKEYKKIVNMSLNAEIKKLY